MGVWRKQRAHQGSWRSKPCAIKVFGISTFGTVPMLACGQTNGNSKRRKKKHGLEGRGKRLAGVAANIFLFLKGAPAPFAPAS